MSSETLLLLEVTLTAGQRRRGSRTAKRSPGCLRGLDRTSVFSMQNPNDQSLYSVFRMFPFECRRPLPVRCAFQLSFVRFASFAPSRLCEGRPAALVSLLAARPACRTTAPSTLTSFCFRNKCRRLFSGQKWVTVGFSPWLGVHFAACDYFRSTSSR